MTSNYVIWEHRLIEGAAGLQDISGFEDTNLLRHGAPLAPQFPGNVAMHMHRDFENSILLVDNVHNLDRLIVVSARLKAAIEARQVEHVEYLPISIIDHRGKIASKDYFIVHPLDAVARIDEQASDFKMSMIKKTSIQSFKRLVLDESSVPADRQLFQLHNFSKISFVRRDLADALSAGGFAGLEWLEIADYPND